MPRSERQTRLQEFQSARDGRLTIAYVTSTRANLEIQIADDVLRLFFDHLEANRAAAARGVDLILHSNGGHGPTAWRLVNLIREYTKDFTVVVPDRAFSAATLIALGANEILMHRMGCLGPIDPSVANSFNPPHPQVPGQLAQISVEDVSAYFKLVTDEVGIKHEDELVQAFMALANKIHPLALGNVHRSHNQSRMMATKLLKKHMPADREHEISSIIDNLKSNLFFHGHPINRIEADVDLKLKIGSADDAIERLMWNVYLEYEKDLQLNSPFNAQHEWENGQTAPAAPTPVTVAMLIQAMGQMAQGGVGLGSGLSPTQLVEFAAAMTRTIAAGQGTSGGRVQLRNVPVAYVESIGRTDVSRLDVAVERVMVGTLEGMKTEALWQRWEVET